MFDHVTLRASDLEAARHFYDTGLSTLELGEHRRGGEFLEWQELRVAEASGERPTTRHAHVGLVAPSREHVDRFWQTLMNAGFRDDGAPGLREKYRPGYYGAFALDPDGNSIEAVHKDDMRTDGRCIDHVWLRVRDVGASHAFYELVGAVMGFRLSSHSPTHATFRGDPGWLAVTSPDESWSVKRPLSEHVHLAFPAADRATVDALHGQLLAAGYRDSGPPGERSHEDGSYAAYVLDPDGNSIGGVVPAGAA